MDEKTARRDIVRVGELMYQRGYVVSSDGNLSVRLDDGRVVATPTQTSKGRMTEDSLAVTDMAGKPFTERRASSELAMHLLIYREREDVRAVCHAHPPHGSAFAVAGHALDRRADGGDAPSRQTSQRAADGEPRRGRLRRRHLAGVRPTRNP